MVDKNFCAYCGQSIKVDKINISNFLSDLSASIFQVNRGLLYTLTALFVRPGHSIREYLRGKRRRHFKPVAYAFALSTIYFLLSQFVGSQTVLNDFVTGYSNGLEVSDVESDGLATLNWFAKNYAYTMLLLLPVYSFASYLAFWGSGFNYLEHFVLNAYVTGQQAIFYSLSSVLSLVTSNHDVLALITVCTSIFYVLVVFLQFFPRQSRLRVVLRYISFYVLSLITLSLLFFIVLLASQHS